MRGMAACALATLLAAVATFAACTPGTDDSTANELRRGNGSEPDSIDPQLARMEAAMTILRDSYEGLVSMAADGSPVPGAAQGWEISTDGRRYTFHVRPEARWSNSDRVVAEEFAAAWRKLVDPATASQYALMLEPVRNAPDIVAGKMPAESLGVTAPDEATLIVDLSEPSPCFLAMLSHPSTFPVHRPTLAARPQEFARPGVAVTNGAFTPAECSIGSHIVAKRNPHYWNDGKTRLDAVRYVHVADPVTELTRFRAGDLDVTYKVPPGEVARIERERPGQLRIAPTVGVYYYGLALDDAARIAEARRLYIEAGYSAAKPLKVELRTSKSPLHDRIALAVTAMWKEQLGAEVSLRSEDFRVLKAAIDAREAPLFRGSWIGDYNDAYSFLQVLKGGFGINLPRYASDPYDAALAMAATASPDKRATYLAAAERQLLTDAPLIPLYFYVSKHLVAPRVSGWYDNVMNVTYSKDLSVTR